MLKDEVKECTLSTRVSPELKELLEIQASIRGLSTSAYVRFILIAASQIFSEIDLQPVKSSITLGLDGLPDHPGPLKVR